MMFILDVPRITTRTNSIFPVLIWVAPSFCVLVPTCNKCLSSLCCVLAPTCNQCLSSLCCEFDYHPCCCVLDKTLCEKKHDFDFRVIGSFRPPLLQFPKCKHNVSLPRRDMTEILLKVALNTYNRNIQSNNFP